MSKLKKSICVLLFTMTFIITLPISVFASVSPEPEKVYDTYIQKPTVTETSGYAELLFYNLSTYEYAPTIVVWNCSPVYDESLGQHLSPVQEIYVDDLGFHLFFNIVQYSEAYFYAGITTYDGRYIDNDYRFNTDGERSDMTFNVSYNGWQLVGANVYGSNITYEYLADYHYEFSILYAAEAYEYTALREIIDYLARTYYQDMTYYSYFYDLLTAILGTPDSNTPSLFTIDTKLASIDGKLGSAVSILQSVLSEFNYKSNGTFAYMLKDKLQDIELLLDDIDLDTEKIVEILTKQGETQNWAKVDNSGITSYEQAENDIIVDDTEDFGNNVLVIIDEASYGTIWTIIEMALQQNAVVYGFFLSVLALAIIALVLNR